MLTTDKQSERQIIPARSPEHAATMDADLRRLYRQYFQTRAKLAKVEAKIYRELSRV